MSLDNVMRTLIGVLRENGAVVLSATIDGCKLDLRIDDQAVAAKQTRPTARSIGREINPDAVLGLIEHSGIGMSLKQLAAKMNAKPRNLLKPALARLMSDLYIVKVGRRFRKAGLVIKRGPKPSGATKPVRAISESKLTALQKARSVLAAKRASAKRKTKRK